MKKNLYSALLPMSICLMFFSISCKKDNVTNSNDEYKLVWADEFNNDGKPNTANWSYETGFVRNEEHQWYQSDNAFCENGLLIIEGRREHKANPNYISSSTDWKKNRQYIEYTSSSLHTSGKHSWKFGRLEMKAKIDTRDGLWPAFWTLGVSGDWPHNGEVDIMEYYRGMVLANIAWGAEQKWQAVWDSYTLSVSELNKADPDWSNKFHIWVMEWDEKYIKLNLDGIMLNMADLTTTYNRDSAKKNPFHQPHYIIVNLAIGGTNGGDPSSTQFPSRYEIDYIRVYQK